MGKGMLVVLVVLLFIAGMGLIAYSLFSTVRVMPRLTNMTMRMANPDTGKDSLFYIRDVYFYNDPMNDTDICTTLVTKQIVIARAEFGTDKKVDSCDLFIDGALDKVVTPYYPDCRGSCPQEVEMVIDVDKKDIYSSHTARLCCAGYCAEKTLPALCNGI